MNKPVIAVVGAGHMGSSLISGLIKDGHPSDKIWACDPSEERLNYLQKTFQIHTTKDNSQAVQAANVVMFAVKPQVFGQVAAPLKANLSHHPLIISIAAG